MEDMTDHETGLPPEVLEAMEYAYVGGGMPAAIAALWEAGYEVRLAGDFEAADSLMKKAHADHCACEQARANERAENARLRGALEFYANRKHWRATSDDDETPSYLGVAHKDLGPEGWAIAEAALQSPAPAGQEPESKECPECEGQRSVYLPDLQGGTDGQLKRCSECGGSGRVPA